MRALLRRPPKYIDSVGRPGEVAVMTAPGFSEGLEHGVYPETVAARILALIGFYSPARTAGNVSCPALFQVMSNDAVTPTNVALRTAGKVRRATVHIHEGGHFDPYVKPMFSEIIEEQLAFQRKEVPMG